MSVGKRQKQEKGRGNELTATLGRVTRDQRHGWPKLPEQNQKSIDMTPHFNKLIKEVFLSKSKNEF